MLKDAGKLAEKYGMAIFELAEEKNLLDAVKEELALVNSLFAEHADLQNFITNPRVPGVAKRDVLRQVFADKVQPFILSFLLLVADRRREAILPDMIKAYNRFLNEKRGVVEACVTTARELSAAEYDALAEQLGKKLSSKVVLEKTIDPSIVGGVVVRIGDKLIDGSVIRQLKRLETALMGIDLNKIGVTNAI